MNKKTRRTPQKLAIFEFLSNNKNHPSAEDIYRALSARFPTMSLSTVYNVLKAFQREGLVTELIVDPEKSRYDAAPQPHHHLVCLACRKIADVERDFKIDLEPSETNGFEIVRRQIDFLGYCSACRSDKKNIHNRRLQNG